MKKYKLYRYIGRNGEITSPILLEDAKHIPLVELRPEPGYILTNGEVVRENFVIVHADEVSEWTEVKADTKD
jgi:hypothetical protein